MRKSYLRDSDKRIIDLLVYFKYYLPEGEYKIMIHEFRKMLEELEKKIPTGAFANIRGQMGIKDLDDLDVLRDLPKKKIQYNKFDTF